MANDVGTTASFRSERVDVALRALVQTTGRLHANVCGFDALMNADGVPLEATHPVLDRIAASLAANSAANEEFIAAIRERGAQVMAEAAQEATR